jgi:hypothetical protein
MKYDCTWGAELCGLTDCTSGPTPKGPACAATSKSVSKNYMGIAELTPPAMDGRSIKHTVRWRNAHGHHLNLTYDALLTEVRVRFELASPNCKVTRSAHFCRSKSFFWTRKLVCVPSTAATKVP